MSTAGFRWLHDEVGDGIQIASFSGGTDICTGIVGGAPNMPVWLGEISCRALGAKVESFSPTGESLVNEVGELVITAPMPSMPVFFWGDDGTRLHDSYFAEYPGVWRHGDWIRITSRGSCVIEGRSDATLNRGGVRMGTAEFYRVVESVPQVVDSLVVDTSSAAGEGDLLLFVVLEDGTGDHAPVFAELRKLIRTELSPRHVPGAIVAVPAVPHTINGKKCEVPVKRILAGADVESAVSRDALADPAGFDAFLDVARSALAWPRVKLSLRCLAGALLVGVLVTACGTGTLDSAEPSSSAAPPESASGAGPTLMVTVPDLLPGGSPGSASVPPVASVASPTDCGIVGRCPLRRIAVRRGRVRRIAVRRGRAECRAAGARTLCHHGSAGPGACG